MTRRLLLGTLPLGLVEILAAAPPSARHRVRFDGVGRLRVGMGEAALRQQVGSALRITVCDSGVYAGWGDPHLGLLLVNGSLARIDVAGGQLHGRHAEILQIADGRLVREAGCEAYMSKPIQMGAFINEVKKLTSPRGAAPPPRAPTPRRVVS